jgi:glycosyltransferase involved in cell wall biosynthesis
VKIAVYTITKNEEKFIQKWYESAKDADYLVILDTGSSDDTVKIAESLGISVHTKVFSPGDSITQEMRVFRAFRRMPTYASLSMLTRFS